MAALLLSDLKLALDDLLTKRAHALHASLSGKLYAPQLGAVHARISALPAAMLRTVPLADELRTIDRDHDGFGAALWHIVEAYLRAPSTPASLQKSAVHIRDFLVPELAQLQADYATEADRAVNRKAKLKEYAKELKAFPIAPNGTLLDWATAFVDNGVLLNKTLSERADSKSAVAKGRPGLAGGKRAEALGLLTRFRGALRDEAKANPKLKGNEAKVFGFLDELSERRPSAPRAKKGTDGATAAAAVAEALPAKAPKKANRRARR